MTKQPKGKKHSVEDIIQSFQTEPTTAYKQLIECNYYYTGEMAAFFWKEYIALDLIALVNKFPESNSIFYKVRHLYTFYHLQRYFETEREQHREALLGLNPHPQVLVRALFLCIELGEASNGFNKLPQYTQESLTAVKQIIKFILPNLKASGQSDYSPSLVELSKMLIKIEMDMELLSSFADLFVEGGFEMKQQDDKGFLLCLPQGIDKRQSQYINNIIKTRIKRDYFRNKAQSNISAEEHFIKYDPVLKTDKGLMTVIVSEGAEVTSQTPGTTFGQVKNSFFEGINSEDIEIQIDVETRFLLTCLLQSFHYNYRQALAEIYEPNEEIAIHGHEIELVHGVTVSLYEILCAVSCLMAKADNYRYIDQWPDSGSIKEIMNNFLQQLNKDYPEAAKEEKYQAAISEVIKCYPEIEKVFEYKTPELFDGKIILGWFKQIEELSQLSDDKLNALLQLLASIDTLIPFNPLYKVGDKYFFSYKTCKQFDMGRILYDGFASDQMFNSGNKSNKAKRKSVGDAHNRREADFVKALEKQFATITPFAVGGLKYLENSKGKSKPEIDLIAYFPVENLILVIEAKLSNISPRTEKRKNEWVNGHIFKEGCKQIKRHLTYLSTKDGLKFIAESLGIGSEIISPQIYPLLVTDNFFVDHSSFRYNEEGDTVLCVSSFELIQLLLNEKIDKRQPDFLPSAEHISIRKLIEMIEQNIFWEFIAPDIENFHCSKALGLINEKYRISINL